MGGQQPGDSGEAGQQLRVVITRSRWIPKLLPGFALGSPNIRNNALPKRLSRATTDKANSVSWRYTMFAPLCSVVSHVPM